MSKREVIENKFDAVVDIDVKYLSFMPIQLDGAFQNVAMALRSRDIDSIENSLIPIANTATNFMYVLGMACLVIEEQRLYDGTRFGCSYIRYAEHLVEKLNIPISTLSESKLIMEVYRDYYQPLKDSGFRIEKNASKLRYLPEALNNHRAAEVYKRIVDSTFRDFRDWAQKKLIALQHTPEREMRIDVLLKDNQILLKGQNILNLPDELDEDMKVLVTEDLKKTFSIREGGNVPFIIETYGMGEQTAIINFLKEFRAKN